MKKPERPKASKREDVVDLISSMPDTILILILSRLPSTEEVIRTSILSTRWRNVWTSVSSLDLWFPDDSDIKIELRKTGFQEFVYWVLSKRSVDLDSFTLCCFDHYSMSTILRWIHMAISRNVKKLDLKFNPKQESTEYEEIKMPHCLVTCRSLEVLKLCLFERDLDLPNYMGFTALRVLELSYVDLLDNDELVKDFFKNCPSLEDLVLKSCFMNELGVLCISCPKLKKFRIENDEEDRMCLCIKICCPKLVFLEVTGPTADCFYFESLDSLKEAVIDPEELPTAPEPELLDNTKSVLFPGISHVESLRINLYFFCQCIDAACDSSLPNLKNLVLTTTFDDFTMDDLNQILNYYPKLESLKLFIKERFSGREEQKLDEAEIRKMLTPDLKRVEVLEFNGEKPKLSLHHCSRYGFEIFMGLVFSWGLKVTKTSTLIRDCEGNGHKAFF